MVGLLPATLIVDERKLLFLKKKRFRPWLWSLRQFCVLYVVAFL